MIKLLQEKRQALITQAVTKGLNPNVRMRDSGIEWLGGVPAHWAVGRLSYFAKRVDVGIAEAATHAYADEGVPLVRSMNIRPNNLDLGSLLFIKPWFAEKNRSKYLQAGDLLTVRTGNVGVTAVVPEELEGAQCFTQLMTTLRDGHDSRFFCYFLNSAAGTEYFSTTGWGTAQKNISVPILGRTPVLVPPTHEQQAIADFIYETEKRLVDVEDHLWRQLAAMSEYRQALISAAVTGKIDVQGAA
jgi:type I restriction enzyme S subunit